MPEPLFSTWAPGRVNLIGEHTDYSGGLVLPVAIEYGITVEVVAHATEIRLSSVLFGEAPAFAADGGGSQAEGWSRYGQAVAAELADLGRPAAGLVGTISSNLPGGAGLSSSAALEVAIALALCAVAEFELEPLELAAACRRAEFRAVGVPCGILDQAGSILGRENMAILLDCATLAYRRVPVPPEAGLVIVDSGIQRSLEHTPYAERRRELEHALELVSADRSTTVQLADLAGLDPVSLRRLRHVVTENGRVERFAAALESGDLVAAGLLLGESHASLRDDYEVSIPELDLLVELAGQEGALGARLLGGGFGGSVLVLVRREQAASVAAAISREYGVQTGIERSAITVRASMGAGIRTVV